MNLHTELPLTVRSGYQELSPTGQVDQTSRPRWEFPKPLLYVTDVG